MKEPDLLHFAPGALVFALGWFVPIEGQLSSSLYAVITCVGAVAAFYSASMCFRVVMNFADDFSYAEGLWHAIVWFLRFGGAFWFWMALSIAVLSTHYTDAGATLIRLSMIFLAIGVIVLVTGVSWYLIYAGAKKSVHRPRR